MSVASRRGFHALDALRGVAALSIVLFHGAFLYGLTPPPEGQVAVDLFFVMSGFIIAYRYDDQLAAGLTLASFLRRRLVRLYPLFVLGMALGAVPVLAALVLPGSAPSHGSLFPSLPLALAMLPASSGGQVDYLYPLNAPAWTLALELLVNAAYAATFPFWTRRRIIGCVVVAFLGLCLVDLRYGTLDVGFFWSHGIGGLARILFGFAAGVLIFRAYRVRAFRSRLPWWGCLLLAALVFAVPPPVARPLWELGLVALAAPTIVAAAAAAQTPTWAHRACSLAGLSSYVVYSIHFPLIGLFMRAETVLHIDGGVASFGKAAAFGVLLFGGAAAAHVFYDRPVRRWLNRAAPSPESGRLGPATKS